MPHALEREVADLIVAVLNLETTADQVLPDAPLFGEESELGLDSIDALELALEIGGRYGFEFEADDDRNTVIFASLRALCRHIEANRTK